MKKLWKNKKICITILLLLILVLVGVIVGISSKNEKDTTKTGKETSGQDIIVHDTNEDTVEEKAEGGLTESDSEDGPVVKEENMIDFNGSDEQGNADTGKNDNGFNDSESAGDNAGNESGDSEDDFADDSTDENPKEDKEEDSKDTGSWGTFY